MHDVCLLLKIGNNLWPMMNFQQTFHRYQRRSWTLEKGQTQFRRTSGIRVRVNRGQSGQSGSELRKIYENKKAIT